MSNPESQNPFPSYPHNRPVPKGFMPLPEPVESVVLDDSTSPKEQEPTIIPAQIIVPSVTARPSANKYFTRECMSKLKRGGGLALGMCCVAAIPFSVAYITESHSEARQALASQLGKELEGFNQKVNALVQDDGFHGAVSQARLIRNSTNGPWIDTYSSDRLNLNVSDRCQLDGVRVTYVSTDELKTNEYGALTELPDPAHLTDAKQYEIVTEQENSVTIRETFTGKSDFEASGMAAKYCSQPNANR